MGRRMQPRNEKFCTLFSKTDSAEPVQQGEGLLDYPAAGQDDW